VGELYLHCISYPGGSLMISLYDIRGSYVGELYTGELTPGDHLLQFPLKGLAQGLYFLHFRDEQLSVTKKVLIRD
jgi:hypothetical protein